MITLSLLRTVALVVMLVGAAASLGLVLYAGRNNHSILLLAIFVVWVLSPFAGLLVASMVSKNWLVPVRITIYISMIVLTLGSVASYAVTWIKSPSKPAFVFLIIPLISLLLIAIAVAIAAVRSRRPVRRSNSV